MEWKRAHWIGIPADEYLRRGISEGRADGHFAWFEKHFELKEADELVVLVSAVSQYKLFVNGSFVNWGPVRGDESRQYYDELDISEYLKAGENAILAQVILGDHNRMKEDGDGSEPLYSLGKAGCQHLFAMEGITKAEQVSVTTGETPWNVRLDPSAHLVQRRPVNDNIGAFCEETGGGARKELFASEASAACVFKAVFMTDLQIAFGRIPPLPMKARPIPLLEKKNMPLPLVAPANDSAAFQHAEAGASYSISSHSRRTFLFGDHLYHNAFVSFRFKGGRGSRLRFCYYERTDSESGVRDDFENGSLPAPESGTVSFDEYVAAGDETVYEPFYYRSFRFLTVEVETAEEPITLHAPLACLTGYPLHAGVTLKSSASWVEPLFDICLRTLSSCMTDSYMDCPYYERMQFVMDSRLQALFTYTVSRDTALARKALEDFHCSMTPDGFVQGKAPSGLKQMITTFSLFYVQMAADYFRRTRDMEMLHRILGDVVSIAEAFIRAEDPDGMLCDPGPWAFIDWQEAWTDTGGEPRALQSGPSALITLLFASALRDAAYLADEAGRAGLAGDFRKEREKLLKNVRALCFDEGRGLFREGPEVSEFTQYTQSLAVLEGLAQGEEAVRILTKTVESEDVLPLTFSAAWPFFRAAEMCGIYELTKPLMDQWIHLLELHAATCPETPDNIRSDCHAWSALPMYELVRTIGGFRLDTCSEGPLVIRPGLSYLPDLSGTISLPEGQITFSYSRGEEGISYTYELTDGVNAVFEGKNGTVPLKAGCQTITEE